MNTNKTRFCPYCRNFKADVGFKFVVHDKTGSKRGQCPACQAMRKRPVEELRALAIKERDERRKLQSEAAKRRIEELRKENLK